MKFKSISKKLIAVLLASALVCSFTGCGVMTVLEEIGSLEDEEDFSYDDHEDEYEQEESYEVKPEEVEEENYVLITEEEEAADTQEEAGEISPASSKSYPVSVYNDIKKNHPGSYMPDHVGTFDAEDIYGNPVNEGIFSNKDITIVNIWGTYCGPCISEMPELGEWAKDLPENVQIIGLCIDVDSADGAREAQSIVEKAGADFTHIAAGTSEFYSILSGVYAVPTTFMVDRLGNIIEIDDGVGVNPEGYKKAMEDYLGELGKY